MTARQRQTLANGVELIETTLVGGQVIYSHTHETCALYWCGIHYPSMHHMVMWDQRWVSGDMLLFRVCEHGFDHPDPDDFRQHDIALHKRHLEDCDGCCQRPFDLGDIV